MEETKELLTTDDIRSKVYIIRGQQVMLDKDLAEIYGYEVKKLVPTTLIISKKPGNTGISRDIRTEFTTDLLLSD